MDFNVDDFIEEVAPTQEVQKSSWKETIFGRINAGKVVPIISNRFTNDLVFFGSHQKLVNSWAKYIQYPHTDQNSKFPQMAQYEWVNNSDGQISDEVQVKEKYLNFLKKILAYMAKQDENISANKQAELSQQANELNVSELAERLNYPGFDLKKNPLLLLAALPLPIYLTTSYHNFLEVALKKARKEPKVEICRWHDGLRDNIPTVFGEDSNYEPTPEQPLIYHLHGIDRYPDSLVLTEDDHLDFLANISKDTTAIHPRVTQAITQSSLVMLGYSVQNWDFRVLFRGLIKPRPQGLWKASVAVQLNDDAEEREYVKKYLRQAKFEVAWTPPHKFIHELYANRGA